MATLADSLKAIAFNVRSIPGQMGLRTHSVTLVSTTWTGPATGDGTKVVTSTLLTEANGQNPKVRWEHGNELGLNALDANTVTIGPITSDFSGGGTSLSMLTGLTTATASTFHLVINGPQYPGGTKFKITTVDADAALHYTIYAQPVA